MFYESQNEFIQTLKMRKKFVNKVCGIIAGACVALFVICCLLPNTIVAMPIIKGLLFGICATNLCYMLATNISFDNAINAELMSQMHKMLNDDSEEYSNDNELKSKRTTKQNEVAAAAESINASSTSSNMQNTNNNSGFIEFKREDAPNNEFENTLE